MEGISDGQKITLEEYVAAYGLGIAAESIEDAWDYGMERVSGGLPIARHQSNSFALADLSARLYAARLATYSAAERLEQQGTKFAEANMAKYLANQLAVDAAEFNRELHGAYGTAPEYRAPHLVHDAWVGQTGEGARQIQLALIASNVRSRFIEK